MAEPIFIVSSARSGSTLLRYMLDTHPAVYAPPELNLGELAAALAVAQAGLHGQRPAYPPHGPLSPEVRDAVRGSISRLMDEHARRRGKSIWCEKSPPNMSSLELLTDLFPDARYVCLYRNHLDTIDSCLEYSRYILLPPLVEYLGRDLRSPIRAATAYWLDVTSKLLELERASRFRTYRVRYEDLVRRPEETLAGLFPFLGLDGEPGLADKVFSSPHDDGVGDMFARFNDRIRAEGVGRGRALSFGLVAEEQRARVEELARELGYAELIAEILAVPAPAAAPVEDSAAPSAGDKGPRWVFETHLPARLAESPEAPSILAPSYRFLISGEGGGSWLLRQAGDGGFEVLADGSSEGAEAATTIGLDAADLLGLVDGSLHVLKLQMESRIVFSGEPPSMEQVGTLVTLFRAAP